MNFDPTASFEDNLARFRMEAERLDPECARILFDYLATLSPHGETGRDRQAIQDFHRAVLTELDALPDATS